MNSIEQMKNQETRLEERISELCKLCDQSGSSMDQVADGVDVGMVLLHDKLAEVFSLMVDHFILEERFLKESGVADRNGGMYARHVADHAQLSDYALTMAYAVAMNDEEVATAITADRLRTLIDRHHLYFDLQMMPSVERLPHSTSMPSSAITR